MNNITWSQAGKTNEFSTLIGEDEKGREYHIFGKPEDVQATVNGVKSDKLRSFKKAKDFCAEYVWPVAEAGKPSKAARRAELKAMTRIELAELLDNLGSGCEDESDETLIKWIINLEYGDTTHASPSGDRTEYAATLSNGDIVNFKSTSEAAAKYRAYRIAHDLTKKLGKQINLSSYEIVK